MSFVILQGCTNTCNTNDSDKNNDRMPVYMYMYLPKQIEHYSSAQVVNRLFNPFTGDFTVTISDNNGFSFFSITFIVVKQVFE